EGVPHLRVQQLAATQTWAEFRARYQEDVSAVVDELVPGPAAELDRAVLDRLLALAPPGVDELMALVQVVAGAHDVGGRALVVDAAPTGHVLRLLEMPGVALAWTHALMRLLLKYRSVVRLEGPGQRVLELSRTL